MRTRRRMGMTATSAAAAALLLLAACGRGDDPADDEQDGSGEVAGEIGGDITVWAMGAEGENLGVLADAFMDEHDDVTVSVTAVPWDAAHDRIVNAIAGGQGPDVSQIGTTWMGEIATLGGLDPTPDSIEASDFFDGAWESTVVQDVSYGVPWYVETRSLYHRTDLAAEGGVSEAPTDWDELRAMAQATVDAGARHGLDLPPGTAGAWQVFMPFFWQQGGQIMADDGETFTLDVPACTTAMDLYEEFYTGGLSATQDSDIPVEVRFTDGDAGAFISGPWMMSILDEAGADRDDWTVTTLPAEESGTSFVGGGNLGVFADSDNKATAWAFVEFVSRPDIQVTWYETVSALPSVESAWDDPTMTEDPMVAVFGEQLEDALAPPAIPTWEQIADVIDSQIEQVAIGGTAPEEACATIQEQASSIGTGL